MKFSIYVQSHNTEFAYRIGINRMIINIYNVFSAIDIFFESFSHISESHYAVLHCIIVLVLVVNSCNVYYIYKYIYINFVHSNEIIPVYNKQ